jgi:uncharacterized membrane protein
MKSNRNQTKWLQDNFVAGLIILAPLIVTIWIIWWVINLATSWLGDVSLLIRFSAFFLVVVFIVATGAITKNYVGERLFSILESFLDRIPLFNSIYGTIQNISDAFKGDKKIFKKVVFIEYPSPGIYSIGFIISDAPVEVSRKFKEKVYSVYLPTTPTPTSGMLLFMPESKIVISKIKISDAIQMVISSGAVVPEEARISNE